MHSKEGFKQVLGRPNAVLTLAGTKFCFEQRKFHRKWANKLAQPTFWGCCRIIRIKSSFERFNLLAAAAHLHVIHI